MNKYEQLIEFIINEDEAKAQELFHQIVVEKSRDIYESLMDEELGGNQVEELTKQVTSDEEGMHESDEEFDSEEGDMDMDPEAEHGEFGHEEEGNVEDRVMDLEDALDELKAEFDALMAGEEAEEHDHPGIHDVGGEDEEFGAEEGDEQMFEADEEDEEDEDGEIKESRTGRKMTEAEWIREYVEKIGNEYPGDQSNPNGHMAGTGAKSEKQGERNTKSPVGPGTDMGGTNKNIARGGAEVDPDGKQIEEPNNEYVKGRGNLKDAGKFKNVPGGNAGKSAYKTQEGSYEKGGDGQGNPTGKMAGTGKNSEKQGEKNVKPLLKKIGN